MTTLSEHRSALLQGPVSYSQTPPIPTELSLEIYTGCNHACLFCPSRKQTSVAPRMHLDDATRWLAEAYRLGVRRVGLHAKGEPFLVRNLECYIRSAADTGYSDIFLTTNGAAATPTRLRSAVEAGLSSLKFSINAYGRERYALVHGADHYDKVIANLQAAAELRASHGIRLYVSCVETGVAEGDAHNLEQAFGHLLDEFVTYPCSNFCGYLDTTALGAAPTVRQAPCNLPFAKLHITPEGLLSGCCGDYQDYLAVADLHHISLAEAWHGEVFQNLRRRHVEKRLEGLICDACLHGKPPDGTVRPLVPLLAKPVAKEYWTDDDIAILIDERNGRHT